MKKVFSYSITAMLMLVVALASCSGSNNNSSADGPPPPFSIAESLVPATSTTSFPRGIDDSVGNCTSVTYPYYMAKNLVTYQLWSTVYTWATNNAGGAKKYTFANPGGRGGYTDDKGKTWKAFTSGHDTDPVTTINWRDAMVWCNALTEYYNARNKTSLGCVYKDTSGNVIRNSTKTTVCDGLNDYDHSAKGFRLPTSMEWELAARYRGSDSVNAILSNGIYYTKGNSASGATGLYIDANATKLVSWYLANSNVSDPNIYSTQPVGKKPVNGNTLGLYDMSGNVWEWCFDRCPGDSGFNRFYRGGRWYDSAEYLQLGFAYNVVPSFANAFTGFRPVRTK